MVDSLRAALRLLPAVRPSLGGTTGTCSRVPKARIHTAPEQSTQLAVKAHLQITNFEKPQQGETGIARFARAVLAYVGAGLSAVTANQLAGPSILQAKELGKGNRTIAGTESTGMWQRTCGNRHVVNEDTLRSPKFGQCPLPHIVSKSLADNCPLLGPPYWSNNRVCADARLSSDTKLDLQWQVSPSTPRDHRSKLDEVVNARLSKPAGLQALAAESNCSLKPGPGLVGSALDYQSAVELQLEWQLIADPHQKSGLPSMFDNRICEENEGGAAFEEGSNNGSRQDKQAKSQLVNALDSGSSEIMKKEGLAPFEEGANSGSKQDDPAKSQQVNAFGGRSSDIMKNTNKCMALYGSLHGDVDKQQVSEQKQGAVTQDMSDHQDTTPRSSSKSSVSWRTADKETLAALVAQKAVERLENCDLPPPHTRSMLKMSLAHFDVVSPSTEKQGDMAGSLDTNLLASLLHGNEPTPLDNFGLSSSNVFMGSSAPPLAAPVHFHRVSQPLMIPSSEVRISTRRGSHSRSADTRNTSWNGGGTFGDRASGFLGEALCHSQTRAREAEKQVQQTSEEKEKLVELLFREASVSLTYQHWVTALQAENMLLRMYAQNEPLEWLHWSIFNPFSVVERMSSRRWKKVRQNYAWRQMEHHVCAMYEKDHRSSDLGGSNDLMIGWCKLGLAFALGLSLAGAGLMLGWSMGWIFLACSVSV